MSVFNLKSEEMPAALAEIQKKSGYTFIHRDLLSESLTHPSYAAEQPFPIRQNQRLEFLGDAVLQLILTRHLFEQFQEEQEGGLTRMRSSLANEAATAKYAVTLGLDRVLLLGKGECQTGGRKRPSILGDVFESFLGAVYLDGGFEAAQKLVLSLLPDLNDVRSSLQLEENPKGALQMLVQHWRMEPLNYELVSKRGPVHEPIFEVRVTVGQRELARATGPNHKQAERMAARHAYEVLSDELAASAGSQEIVVLDFDGVICDSAGETGASGWKTAREIWPELFPEPMPSPEQLAMFRKVRPALETGYHAPLLFKMLQEGLPMEEFEQRASEHYGRIMREHNLDRNELIDHFGRIRDQWIAENLDEWLDFHGFFPGVLEALQSALESGRRILISTTKQERFVKAALESRGVHFPMENIYGLDRRRPKEDLLAQLLEACPPAISFTEDRLKTLLRVETHAELDAVRLHYAAWGYGTASDLENARMDPRIHVLSLEEFNDFLAGRQPASVEHPQ
ncbi:MAG: ribonuclease III [Victivallales bacterium]|nr:ribonuclease III [Victivallales bacterium]